MDETKLENDKKAIEKRTQQTLTEIQKELQTFAELGAAALTDDQKGFIRARRSYLSDEQKELFKDVLAEKKKVEASGDEVKEPKLEELKERGAKFGLEYKVGSKKADFQKLVEEAEAAEKAKNSDQE